VEEIVGDIADEHDRLGDQARPMRDGSWVLSGLLRPDEVEDVTGIALPEHEDYDTIAGLVLRTLGRIPRVGEVALVPLAETDHAGEDGPAGRRVAELTVIRMDGLRVDRIRARVRPPAGPGGGAPGGSRS
jgi:CBS domain containing-hemolysin-like protein